MTHNLLQKCYLSTEHIASAVFVIFWLVLPIRERKDLCGLVKKHTFLLYLQILNTLKLTNIQAPYSYKVYRYKENRRQQNTCDGIYRQCAIFVNFVRCGVRAPINHLELLRNLYDYLLTRITMLCRAFYLYKERL